jgi:hypothetical protein
MNKEKLVSYINSHKWWRTALPDEKTIKARGIFYTSSYCDAEFYGRPIDEPFDVSISKPLFGDEPYIMHTLDLSMLSQDTSLKERFRLDSKMMRIAIDKGFDSIALMTTKGYEQYKDTGKIPRSIELQVFKVDKNKLKQKILNK